MPSTPSERQHLKINPYPIGGGYKPRNPVLLVFKNLFGAPVPLFLALYVTSTMVSMSGMEIFGWAVGALTLCYIFIDRFSSHKEIPLFRVGADLWLFLLLVISSLGLLLNAPEADFWKHYGKMRWVIMLYLLTYAHFLFPGIKRYFHIMMVGGFIVSLYALIQHFTGLDLRYELGLRAESAVNYSPMGNQTVYQVVGFFGHHLTYGYVFSLITAFSFAGLFLLRNISQQFRVFLALTCLLLLLSLLWTYGRGVWIATACSLLFMAGFISRKLLLSALLAMIVTFIGLYELNPNFQRRVDTILDSDYRSNSVRENLWTANLAMVRDHPWVGLGINQNEARSIEYQERLGLEGRLMKGHAHNSYIQWLSTTGVLGFICYMFFVLTFLLITYKLWITVPITNSFHRTMILGALGAQVSLHVGGLTQWNFGDAEVNHLFIFILSLVAYMNKKYSETATPDDQSL